MNTHPALSSTYSQRSADDSVELALRQVVGVEEPNFAGDSDLLSYGSSSRVVSGTGALLAEPPHLRRPIERLEEEAFVGKLVLQFRDALGLAGARPEEKNDDSEKSRARPFSQSEDVRSIDSSRQESESRRTSSPGCSGRRNAMSSWWPDDEANDRAWPVLSGDGSAALGSPTSTMPFFLRTMHLTAEDKRSPHQVEYERRLARSRVAARVARITQPMDNPAESGLGFATAESTAPSILMTRTTRITVVPGSGGMLRIEYIGPKR